MQKQLMKIMQLRYWKYLVGLFVILVGIQVIGGNSAVNVWKRIYKTNHSKIFIKSFKEHPEYYIQNDSSAAKTTKTLKTYQVRENQFFRNTDSGSFEIDSMTTVAMVLVIFGAGLMTFTIDRRTNFDTFLFSLTSSRRRIYWTKLLYGIGTVLGSLIISHFVYYLIIKVGIKAPYVQLNITNLVQHEIGQLVLILGIYIIGCLIGLVIGELPT
ncbi:hypothetical protein ABRQ21_02385, partial [Latilactobacillus sakei]